MKLPRDISGRELARTLSQRGYSITRQTGSHMRLTTTENGEHHITIPGHDPLRIGTLSAILTDICDHFDMPRDELLERFFA